MVDVFDQVEEELRSDRYKRLARTWLPVVGGVLLVALIAALSWWGWQSWQTAKADKGSVAFQRGLESLQADNAVGADAAFVQAGKEGNGAYRWAGLNMRAASAVEANRIEEAVRLFDEAAGASRDPLQADISALKAAWLVMDTASLADITARLEPLTGEKRPYRAYAREALALAQLQHGETAKARETFVVLKNALDTPELISRRADAAIGSIDSGTAGNLGAIVRAAAPAETPQAPPAAPAAPARP